MANRIDIPFINPVRMVPVESQPYVNYTTELFRDLIKPFEYSVEYYQKWHPEMIIRMQVATTYTPIKIEVVRCDGVVIQTYPGQVINNPAVLPGWQCIQFNMTPPDIDEVYYFILSVGEYNDDPSFNTLIQYISEPQKTIQSIAGMLVFEYTHSLNNFGVVFTDSTVFTLMCEGGFKPAKNKRIGSSFRTSNGGAKNNTNIPVMEWPLILGHSEGVPPYICEKVNRIFACDSVLINGRPYSCPVENEFEEMSADFYPMYGYLINVNDEVNRYSLTGENGATQSQYFFVTFDIETRSFGTMNGPVSNNLIRITKIG